MFSEISVALDQVRSSDDEPAGRLRLNVPVFVARQILPAIVVPFLAAHPRITLEVESRDTFVDVFAESFDAGIRYDESLDLDMVAVPIGPREQRFATVASPAYLEKHGIPRHPRDFLEHACIRHKFESGRLTSWEFERDGEAIRIDPGGPLIANTMEIEHQAALGGLGFIATFLDAVRSYVESGELVEVLSDWQQPFSGPFLYYPSRRHMPSPLRAFVDFVKRN
jgi:DNA-binding transcriptional LysR family regulator